MKKIKAGIIGASGYAGGELVRLLLFHPNVSLVFAHSRNNSGIKIAEIFPDLLGDTEMEFTQTISTDIDVVFLCLAHGEAKTTIEKYGFDNSVKIIDLSQDFRLKSSNSNYVYGLPELNKDLISGAQNVANPGCFATAVQLALLPLAANNLIQSDVFVSATTGSTGAGQSLSNTSHFSWRQGNLSVYKAFTHQHLKEINQTIKYLQPSITGNITMIPQRGAFTRGILASVTLECSVNIETTILLYKSYYANHPFVQISTNEIDLKQVVNTNKCFLYLEKHNNQLMIVSIIDNLLKGASGQAVQNMNLMFGLDEKTGLKLKATAY